MKTTKRTSKVNTPAIVLELAEVATNNTLRLDKLLRALADLVGKIIDCELLAVLLKEHGTNYLRVIFATGHGERRLKNRSVRVGRGVTGLAAASRKTVVVNDVDKSTRYIKAVQDVRSEMAIPLMAQRRLIGVLDFESTAANAFGEHERRVLQLIANRIALALDNARLHRGAVLEASRLRTLLEASQEFSTILELDELINRISILTRQLIRYDAFSVFFLNPGKDVLQHHVSLRFDNRNHIQNVPLSGGIVGAAARRRCPVLVRDVAKDHRYVSTIPGIRSEVAVPLMVKDRIVGVLDLESEREGFFTRDDISTLSLLAPQLAAAIENARLYEGLRRHEARLENDLESARQLQQSLLAHPMAIPGLQVAACNEPAISVSGDVYEFFDLPGHGAGVFLGDVSGHGTAAALYGAMAIGLFRQMAPSRSSPAALLEGTNHALCTRRIGSRYIASLCVQWLPEQQSLVIASAGGPPPMLSRGGNVERLHVEGLPLGLIPGTTYDERIIRVGIDDILVLASDGILEATTTESDEQYGYERLGQVILANRSRPASDIVRAIFEDVSRYTSGGEIQDDRTAVVLKIAGL